jgi:hypothetical protein
MNRFSNFLPGMERNSAARSMSRSVKYTNPFSSQHFVHPGWHWNRIVPLYRLGARVFPVVKNLAGLQEKVPARGRTLAANW